MAEWKCVIWRSLATVDPNNRENWYGLQKKKTTTLSLHNWLLLSPKSARLQPLFSNMDHAFRNKSLNSLDMVMLYLKCHIQYLQNMYTYNVG